MRMQKTSILSSHSPVYRGTMYALLTKYPKTTSSSNGKERVKDEWLLSVRVVTPYWCLSNRTITVILLYLCLRPSVNELDAVIIHRVFLHCPTINIYIYKWRLAAVSTWNNPTHISFTILDILQNDHWHIYWAPRTPIEKIVFVLFFQSSIIYLIRHEPSLSNPPATIATNMNIYHHPNIWKSNSLGYL